MLSMPEIPRVVAGLTVLISPLTLTAGTASELLKRYLRQLVRRDHETYASTANPGLWNQILSASAYT